MAMHKKFLMLLAGLVLAGQAWATNLLVNGDFAQADPNNPTTVAPPGWTNVGGTNNLNEGLMPNSMFDTPPYQRAGQPDTVNYYDFGGFGRGYATVGTGIAQTFATVPGRQYRLSFAMSSEFTCTDPSNVINQTQVTAGDLDVTVPVPYIPSYICGGVGYEPDTFRKAWVIKTYTFNATSNSTTLKFVISTADTSGANDPLITGVEVTEISPLLTVNKRLSATGRISPSDQFTVQIKNASNAVVNDTTNSTTEGAGALISAGKGTTGPTRLTPGASYSLAEVMAPGSVSPLTYYSSAVSCTNTKVGGTNVSGITTLTSSLVLAADDVVTCEITNTAVPPVGGISGRVFIDVGRSGGVANDGVLNGSEQPLSGVSMQLTNCGSTVYAQTQTDGQGAYSFKSPSVAVGVPLCVIQTNITPYVSTGASVSNSALPSGTAVAVSGTSYTYARSTDQVAFSWNGTGHADINFGDVPQGQLVASGTKTGLPGSTVNYAHTFTAGSEGTVVFSVSTRTATPSLSGWSERIFLDEGCTGTLQASAQQIFPGSMGPISVVPQQTVCVIVQQYLPATAQVGYKNDIKVQAAFSYKNATPALSSTYGVNDVTQADNVSLNLFKEVRNVTQGGSFGANNQAKSGDVLEYRITYTNMSSSVLSTLTINDTTPAYTNFVSASVGNMPPSLTDCVKNTPANPSPAAAVSCASNQPAGGSGAVVWRFTGSLPGSGTGQVFFQVRIQ